MTGYAELVAATSYSFLRGASQPSDMVGTALERGYAAIGIADRNTVAGVVRAYVALRDAPDMARAALIEARSAANEPPDPSEAEDAGCRIDMRLLVGARLVFVDGTADIVAYPATRRGWGRLTRLLTLGNRRAVKGDCILRLDDLADHLDDLLLIVLPESTATEQTAHRNPPPFAATERPPLRLAPPASRALPAVLAYLSGQAPGRVWLGATIHRRGADDRRMMRLASTAAHTGVPLIAVGDALYATSAQRPLHDVMTCIREGVTITEAGRRLESNAERHLKPVEEMNRLFRRYPEAIAETRRFAERINFTLDHLRYEYPHEPVPEGWAPQDWLEHIVTAAAHERYGATLPLKVRRLLDEEFDLIRTQEYAYYFLTVHDLVRFARTRQPPILCQGRGSAANSIVCFLLGVTSVDPLKYDLLFSRFVSKERSEPPDIDVDFEHERREEVMQYIYDRYGRDRAGIAATVIHYRPRSAVREIGKVLGFTEDVTARLSGTVWGSFASDMEEKRYAEAGFDPNSPDVLRLRGFVDQLLRFPRHLSQHVGGFVLTQDRLDETVPIHNAAMDDRTFIEWDKDDIDALGLMKVDVLALGMLTCIRKAFDLMRQHGLGDHDLEVDLDAEDSKVYDMLCDGESLGVFQVESRAQMNMLPRLRPRKLYDLTVQVAIVRPGPIEGEMVHPYLRRRQGLEKVEYPSPAPPHDPKELETLLGETYGVPLFQEQAMKLAIVAAGFSPEEANRLRRAMATFRNVGKMHDFHQKMTDGMVARGYERDFAERCYRQIEGFGSYGFPESHALSFARLVYVSSWIKCHHPAVFACALLNSQPMGFYSPAQIVGDARKNEVDVRPIDVKTSFWDNSLESRADGSLALRLGFRQLDGFREVWAGAIAQARASAHIDTIEDLARCANLPRAALDTLAQADAFASLGLDRRGALWEARRTPRDELPLFAAARARELAVEPDMALPQMGAGEHVAIDYQTMRLSLRDHPMRFIRPVLTEEGMVSSADIAGIKAGARLTVAGIVLVRQRPGKGNAIFVTLEDEAGVINIIMWARTFDRFRRAVMSARLMEVTGELQRSPEGVLHVMAARIRDRSALLGKLTEDPDDTATAAPVRAHHPRDVRLLPKSRDFH
ncbi:Error-prone DNA polymerase [Sphingomonas sp. EC-HK361]|uniref:error-prone DNA polymerase n=1 Tax=Sphingomonas sp. EC-HK361 TaxID=2038397 RepID=UPI00125BA61A|nr:error-prone DNA polymerase [Sphingomonas sp. EC-HK361]VVT07901.1 Error-prone DNA polymerase [Sphingomonas sp. EC-HK361]